ncbi:MAG: hypothetical protein WBO10_12960 [Pyrinomonadaceae bacterium]
MKQIILLFALLTLATAAFAQPTTIRRDAEVTRLTKRFENVETIKRLPADKNTPIRLERAIQSAENELGRFKEKYPDYDVARFEKALADFKNPQAASTSGTGSGSSPSGGSEFGKADDFVAVIETILDLVPPRLVGGGDKAVAEAKQKLLDFQAKTHAALTPEFLALAKDTSNRKITRIADKASREAVSIDNRLKNVKADDILALTDPQQMLTRYLLIAYMLEQVNVLDRIFENDAGIMAANSTASGLIARLGKLEEVDRRAQANYAAKVAANRLFPERQNNAALRTEAINAFNSSVYSKPGNKVLKANLASSGWSTNRNEITGIILSRDQQVHIAYKAADGKCYAYLMRLEQKHQGGGKYSRGIDRAGSTSEILCENVAK